MPKFVNIFEKPAYFEQALFLYAKSAKFMDDDFARELAQNDPRLFFQTYKTPILIDEIQKASDKLIFDSENGTRQINESWENAKILEKGFGSIMASSQSVASNEKNRN